MLTKTQIIRSLDNLPDSVTIDQVIDHLVLIEKINNGLDDSVNDRINSKEEAKQKLHRWLK